MSKLIAARSAQYPLWSSFTFNFDDTFVDIDGVTKTFGSVHTDDMVASIMNLPEGAVVVAGELIVETAFAGCTAATLSLGDSTTATRYASTVDLMTAGRTALTLTGYRTTENLRATQNVTVANATAGKATVRVGFVLPGRANEAIPN